jgi:hypothetical protein
VTRIRHLLRPETMSTSSAQHSRKPLPPIVRRTLIAFLTAAALFVHYANIKSGIPNHGSDFEQDYALTRAAMQGENPYSFLRAEPPSNPKELVRVNHPPGVAIILFPLSLLTLDQAYVAFCVLSLSLFLYSLALLGNELQLPRNIRIPLLIMGLSWWPTMFSVRMGSLSLLIAGLLVIGWVFAQRGRHCVSGALIASAVHLKLFPLLLPIQFLVARTWRQFAWTVVWIIALGILVTVTMGTRVWMDFLLVACLYREHAEGSLLNISLYGLGEQLFGAPHSLLTPVITIPNAAPRFGAISSAIIFALSLVHWARRPTSPNNYMISLCAMILVSPAAWAHTIAILALPLIVGLLPPHTFFWAMVATLSLVSFPDLTFVRVVENVLELRPPWSATIGALLRLPTLGTLLLFGLLLKHQFRPVPLPDRPEQRCD